MLDKKRYLDLDGLKYFLEKFKEEMANNGPKSSESKEDLDLEFTNYIDEN